MGEGLGGEQKGQRDERLIPLKNWCFIKEACFIYTISTTAKRYSGLILILVSKVAVKTQDYKQ